MPLDCGHTRSLPSSLLFLCSLLLNPLLNLSAGDIVPVVHEILISDVCFDDAVILRSFQQIGALFGVPCGTPLCSREASRIGAGSGLHSLTDADSRKRPG